MPRIRPLLQMISQKSGQVDDDTDKLRSGLHRAHDLCRSQLLLVDPFGQVVGLE